MSIVTHINELGAIKMRTFHNIKLYQKIEENPYVYIGQKSFHLFECFMMQIDAKTELKIENNELSKYVNIPDIRTFVSNELSVKIPESLRWTWAIGFEVEDEMSLLKTYFKWIKDYEEHYPADKRHYNFNLKSDSKNDFTSLLKHICERPTMYGISNLSGIRAVIDGFLYLKEHYASNLSANEMELKNFVKYWKTQTNKKLKFDTWDRPLVKEELGINPFTFGSGSNGGWVFDRFIQIIKEQTKIEFADLKTV